MSLRRGPVNRHSSFPALFFALFSFMPLGISGCTKKEEAPPAPRPSWMIVAKSLHKARDGAKPERCNLEGKDCKALAEAERFEGNGIIKTGADSRVSLQLDDATSIDVLENSSVKFVPDDDGAIAPESGSMIVEHAAEGTRKNYALRLPGTIASWTLDRDETFAVRMVSDGGAVLSVRRGAVKLQSKKNESFEVLSGETARLFDGKAPDKRAVWAGLEAPAEFSEKDRFAEPLTTSVPRGFGSMTARVPGTGETIQGVRLASHKVQVLVRDGYARTEIEEEFFNDTPQVLEGRYRFPLPADASISRLALWVGNDLVEGEVLEKDRAKAIFQQIVDDTVRPRDPALLEWVSGSEFSLKIFPIPAKGSRKVILAYNQILPAEGGRVRYVYPLSLGADRATKINDFSMSIRAMNSNGSMGDVMTPGYAASIATKEGNVNVDYQAKEFVPNDDFVVNFKSGSGGTVRAASYTPKEGEFQATSKSAPAKDKTEPAKTPQENYFALRLEAALPEGAPLPERSRRDIVLTVDTSHSQSRETLDRSVKLVGGLLRQMDPDEQFVIMACDSACSVYPEKGFAASSAASMDAAEKWLGAKTPGGSSDIAGALLSATERLGSVGKGQLIYLGDGAASSGELSVDTIASRVRSKMDPQKYDLRFLGMGRTVDDVTLAGLARTFGGTYERVQTGDHLEERIGEIGMGLRSPVVRWVTAILPEGMTDVYPRQLPNLRLGQEIMLFGKMTGPATGDVQLNGDLAGTKYGVRKALNFAAASTAEKGNPLVPRLWAESRLRDLETSDDQTSVKEAVELSKRFHVMSRHTSFLVLENEQMFAEFGVQRTTKKAEDQSDQSFAAEPDATSPAEAPGIAGGGAAAPAGAPLPRSKPTMRDGFESDDSPAPSPKTSTKGRPRGRRWVQERTTTHSLEKADWNKAGEEELQKLRAAVTEDQKSRRKRTALVRGLIQRGRFEDALAEAKQFADSDPDQSEAHELVGQAAAASGNMQQAVLEMDTQAELQSRRTSIHTFAARAFEAAGDEKRACAHWRSAAELDSKSDDFLTEAYRCRARVLDGREAALHDAKAIEKPGPRLKKFIETLEKGEAPAFITWLGGYLFKAEVQCGGQRPATPPHLIVINHLGVVISPWTPTLAPTGPGLAEISFSMPQGTYRTVVWGTDGAQCELLVDASGTSKKFPLAGGSTVVKTTVEVSGHWSGSGWRDSTWDL